ncbi:MAG: hypothetical protein K0S27_661 [Gammaproteobacteria bacterium]|jgi:hypothetical protein|nr:hypothetical protein [Gammaproteobacteria bacterium]
MSAQALLAIQPESYKQQLLRSLKLYKLSFFHVLHFALLLSIILFIPRFINVQMSHDFFLGLSLRIPSKLWIGCSVIAVLFFYAALLWRMRCITFNVQESLFNDMKVAMQRLAIIIMAVIIESVIFTLLFLGFLGFYYFFPKAISAQFDLVNLAVVMSGLIFYLYVILYVYFLFIFYLPLILAEKKGMFSALGKSAFLVWKNWWRTFWLQITPWSFYLASLLIIKQVFVGHFHLSLDFKQQSSLLATVLHILIFALFIPWTGATLLVQLRDLELRKNYTMLHGKKRTKNSARL